jgi:hypothetical protein
VSEHQKRFREAAERLIDLAARLQAPQLGGVAFDKLDVASLFLRVGCGMLLEALGPEEAVGYLRELSHVLETGEDLLPPAMN